MPRCDETLKTLSLEHQYVHVNDRNGVRFAPSAEGNIKHVLQGQPAFSRAADEHVCRDNLGWHHH